jgi:hypothetical protein
MRGLFILLSMLSTLQLSAQSKHGSTWLVGSFWQKLNFQHQPLSVDTLPNRTYNYFHHGHSNICDTNGNLILACDGYNIYDSLGNYIEDGDSLVSLSLYIDLDGFSSFSQTSILIPTGNNIYYLITPNATDSIHQAWYTIPYYPNAWFDELLVHKIDMNANGGMGKVVERGKKIMKQEKMLRTMMMACRHANGKDWWLLKQMYEDSGNFDGPYPLCKNKIAKILITKDSIYPATYQYFNAPDFGFFEQSGQAMFSQDGTKYASTCRSTNKVFLADFDRCTGELSNGKSIAVPNFSTHNPSDTTLQDVYTQGLCFSPNGQFLYVNKFFNLLQYDLSDPDSATAWYHIAGLDTTWQAFQKYSSSYIGPDGKIYVGNWWGISKQMSVINIPNAKGVACDFCPRCLRFPYPDITGASTPPNMPNYALGADLPCWPLSSEGVGPDSYREGVDELVVYPNPASSKLEVRYEIRNKRNANIEMYNTIGQRVYSSTISNLTSHVCIDVSRFASGVYYLKCGNFTKKIIIE